MRARLAAVLVLALAAGCSALEFAYNNADTWVRWQAGNYLDLEEAQAREFDRRLQSFLAWHRAEALPHYARLAAEAGKRLERGASRDDMNWGYDAVRQQLRLGLRQAGAALGELLDGLSSAQIEALERRLAEDDRKFARRWVAGTPAERRDRRFTRAVHTLQDWLGELSDAQRARVREFNESAPLNGALRGRERRRLRAELVAMLHAREGAAHLADWAAHWDAGRDPEFAAANQATTQAFLLMLADLERTLSARQRSLAVARLREYARDFDLLASAR